MWAMPKPSKFLTTAEVAAELRVDPATVRRWIAGGALPALAIGRDYRIERADLDELIARSRISQPFTVAGGAK